MAKNDIVTASEMASIGFIIVSGFQFCKYLLSTKAAENIQEASHLAVEITNIEKIVSSISIISFALSLAITICYDHEKLKKAIIKLNSRQYHSKKIVRAVIVTIFAIPIAATLFADSVYTFFVVILILVVAYIVSGKLNRQAVFCLIYLVVSFFITIILIFNPTQSITTMVI